MKLDTIRFILNTARVIGLTKTEKIRIKCDGCGIEMELVLKESFDKQLKDKEWLSGKKFTHFCSKKCKQQGGEKIGTLTIVTRTSNDQTRTET